MHNSVSTTITPKVNRAAFDIHKNILKTTDPILFIIISRCTCSIVPILFSVRLQWERVVCRTSCVGEDSETSGCCSQPF